MDAERGADGVDAKAAWIGGRIALCIVLDILSSALSRSSACCLASRLLRSCCSSVSCSATQCRRSLTFDCAACSWPCSRAARSCCSRSSAMAAGRPEGRSRSYNPFGQTQRHALNASTSARLAPWGGCNQRAVSAAAPPPCMACLPSCSCCPVDEEGRLEQWCSSEFIPAVKFSLSFSPPLMRDMP